MHFPSIICDFLFVFVHFLHFLLLPIVEVDISDIAIISGITNMVKDIILVINNTPQKTYRIAQYTDSWNLFHSLISLRTACVMYTCFITPNQCPCLMRPLPCMAICRNTTMMRAASNQVSLSPLPRQCGARWAVHGRHSAEMRRAPRSQSRRMPMLPPFINSSDSPTTLPSLLL
jgi:hypothetical protein